MLSHSRPASPADPHKEREASKHRLLDVWASLADRYTRRLDEDDIVNIRTGKITIDRGFIRKSRTVDFGAIAAPADGDGMADESEEDEKDLDELDAFADRTDEVDVTGTDLRVKPVPRMTAMNLVDAEDLRSFLEAERRRKHLCGSDVEVEEEEEEEEEEEDEEEEVEEVAVHIEEPNVVEREIVNLISEDELDNWDVDDSSVVVVLKQDDSDIPSSSSTFRTPSIPRAESETLQKSLRKRKRAFSESDNLLRQDQPPTVYKIPDNKAAKHKSPRRSSSRSQRPRPSPSLSGSESELGYISDSEQEYNHKPSRSQYDNFQLPYYYPYPHHHQPYLPSPHRNHRRHHHHQLQLQHHPPPPEMFAPPIPDPRAQFIITQAMHQLSALVGTPWIPPHDSSSFIPHTPSRRHQSRRANSIFNTPNHHPHPYPYSYDPNLSFTTLPPESSPEPISSPEKLSSSSTSHHGPRKSSLARARSRSRGRHEFDRGRDRVEVYDHRVDVYPSPSKTPPQQQPPSSRREVVREHKSTITTTWPPSKGKGKGKKARAETSDREYSAEEESPSNRGRERDDRRKKSYLRGKTPGPEIGLAKGIMKKNLGQDSKRRLKGARPDD